MFIRRHKIFLYLLLLLLLQCKVVSASDNIYRDLVDRGIATYEDGCRAISYFANVSSETMTFEEVVVELKEKGIIGKRWKYEAEKPLTRGVISYMACKVVKMKGGLTMRVIAAANSFANLISRTLKIKNGKGLPDIGVGKRYAYLEFRHKGVVPDGHNKTYLTGHDLLALVYRVEQYIKAEEREKKQKKAERAKKEQKKLEKSKPEEIDEL